MQNNLTLKKMNTQKNTHCGHGNITSFVIRSLSLFFCVLYNRLQFALAVTNDFIW